MLLSSLFHRIGFDIDYAALQKLDDKLALVKEQTNQVFGGMSKIAQGVGNIGKSLTMWVTAPIVGFGALSVKTAADVEQLELALKDVVPAGTNVAKLFQQLNEFTRKSNFSKQQVYEYANSLIQAKVPVSELTGMLQKLGDINAANAGKMGKGIGGKADMTDMVHALAMMRARGTIELQQVSALGPAVMMQLQKQLGMHGVLFSQFMGTHIVNYDMVMRAVDTVARERAGYMIKQTQTLSGLFSQTAKAIQLMAQEIGELLIKDLHLKEVLAFLIDHIYKLVDGFKKLPGWVRTSLLILTGIAALAGPVLILVSAIFGMIASISAGILMLSAFASAFPAVVSAITAAILPFLGWTAIIGAVIAVLWLLYDDVSHWAKGQKSLIGILLGPWEEWKDSMIEFFHEVGQTFVDLLKLFVPGGKGQWDIFKDIKDFGKTLNVMTGDPLGALKGAVTKDLRSGSVTHVNAPVTIQVPYGTPEQQQQFLKDTTKQAFDEHFNRILNQTSKADTFPGK